MIVRPIRVDFAPSSLHPGIKGWGLIGVTFVALLWSLIMLVDIQQTVEVDRTAKQQLLAEQTKQKHLPVQDPRQAKALANQVHAVNQHIRQLNLPWDTIMATVRPAKGIEVELLGLETGTRMDGLRVKGFAHEPLMMTEYLAYLAEKPSLRDVYLVKHENLRSGGLHFELEATWQRTH